MRLFALLLSGVMWSVVGVGQSVPYQYPTMQSYGLASLVGQSTITDGHSVSVTRTGPTVLSIGNGATATSPQMINFPANSAWLGPMSIQVTSALTLTSVTGGASGYVYIYAIVDTANNNAIRIVVINNLGMSLTCTGSYNCSAVTSQSSYGRQAITQGVYLYAWAVTTGTPATFNSGGGFIQNTNQGVYVYSVLLANSTGAAITATLTDYGNSLLPYLTTTSVPANGTVMLILSPFIEMPVFVDRGLRLTASATGLYYSVQYKKPIARFNPVPPS